MSVWEPSSRLKCSYIHRPSVVFRSSIRPAPGPHPGCGRHQEHPRPAQERHHLTLVGIGFRVRLTTSSPSGSQKAQSGAVRRMLQVPGPPVGAASPLLALYLLQSDPLSAVLRSGGRLALSAGSEPGPGSVSVSNKGCLAMYVLHGRCPRCGTQPLSLSDGLPPGPLVQFVSAT